MSISSRQDSRDSLHFIDHNNRNSLMELEEKQDDKVKPHSLAVKVLQSTLSSVLLYHTVGMMITVLLIFSESVDFHTFFTCLKEQVFSKIMFQREKN